METKPDKAVSIIECDMNVRSWTSPQSQWIVLLLYSLTCCYFAVQVDFDAPLGYKEPERRPNHQDEPTVRSKPSW